MKIIILDDLFLYMLLASLILLLMDFLRAILRKWMIPKLSFLKCWPEYRLLNPIILLILLMFLTCYLLNPPDMSNLMLAIWIELQDGE